MVGRIEEEEINSKKNVEMVKHLKDPYYGSYKEKSWRDEYLYVRSQVTFPYTLS